MQPAIIPWKRHTHWLEVFSNDRMKILSSLLAGLVLAGPTQDDTVEMCGGVSNSFILEKVKRTIFLDSLQSGTSGCTKRTNDKSNLATSWRGPRKVWQTYDQKKMKESLKNRSLPKLRSNNLSSLCSQNGRHLNCTYLIAKSTDYIWSIVRK